VAFANQSAGAGKSSPQSGIRPILKRPEQNLRNRHNNITGKGNIGTGTTSNSSHHNDGFRMFLTAG
jgi:hypothetical protein